MIGFPHDPEFQELEQTFLHTPLNASLAHRCGSLPPASGLEVSASLHQADGCSTAELNCPLVQVLPKTG
jgi:hypothetical protein